ncbi:MAG: AAA family ATPase [Phycisphaerales bacterium]|nr:AAA family ATPase [Planctomycetota bacterium]MCH8507646.1 AAA family ATPase [Phycisphaerales bacterium]
MRQDDETMLRAAKAYHKAGLCVLPAVRNGNDKKPAVGWTPYQSRSSTPEELNQWFGGPRVAQSMCVLTGTVSGDLEMIDFDLGGDAFEPWRAVVEAETPGLLDRLVIESTPSGGRHAVYRCEQAVGSSTKLAMRRFPADGPDEVEIHGKRYKPRYDSGAAAYYALVTLIETRGEGGLFLCDPSPGYEVTQGDLAVVPVITADERETLLAAARSLNEAPPKPRDGPPRSGCTGSGLRPGDDFNARGDPRPLLEADGWRLVRPGENEHWCRPGKVSGTSATLKGGVFYVFTSNAPPFEPNEAYSPFAVYALLQHAGDFSAAAKSLARQGFGMNQMMMNPGLLPLASQCDPGPVTPDFVSVGDLVQRFKSVRPPVIHGLLREGETMNVIAAPKTGKSWLTLDLAVSIAIGGQWLGQFQCERGDVLILDNELHSETSAERFPKVVEARGMSLGDIGDRVFVETLRGRLLTTLHLRQHLDAIEPGRFKVIVLDAFYRFMPPGFSENDNGQMASVYNELDCIANRLQCSFVLVHHSSKGDQSTKAITDVGAGAGAQSRATDTHLILRSHREDDAVVLDATVRSWPPVTPCCLRWSHPVWNPAPDLNPNDLRQPRKTNKQNHRANEEWDPQRFTDEFVSDQPQTRVSILGAAKVAGLSKRGAKELLDLAVEQSLVTKLESGRNRPQMFLRDAATLSPREVA